MAVTQLAMAELPFPTKALGQIEGTLDFCAQMNPKAAAEYKERGKAIIGKASEKDLAEARTSAEYKESYNWISGELRKAQKDDAAKACANLLEEK